jgi:hypothetical protein
MRQLALQIHEICPAGTTLSVHGSSLEGAGRYPTPLHVASDRPPEITTLPPLNDYHFRPSPDSECQQWGNPAHSLVAGVAAGQCRQPTLHPPPGSFRSGTVIRSSHDEHRPRIEVYEVRAPLA